MGRVKMKVRRITLLLCILVLITIGSLVIYGLVSNLENIQTELSKRELHEKGVDTLDQG